MFFVNEKIKRIFAILTCFTVVFCLSACNSIEKEAKLASEASAAVKELQLSLAKLSDIPKTSSQIMIDTCTELAGEAIEIFNSEDNADLEDKDYIAKTKRFIKRIEEFNDKVDRILD